MREDEDFGEHERDAENEKRGHLPARQAGKVVAEEKEREADGRENTGQAGTGNFEFEPGKENTAEQKKRCERGDPKSQPLEAGRLDGDDLAFETGFLHDLGHGVGDPFGENRFAIDPGGGFLRAQGEEGTLRVNDAVADLHLFLLVHERFAHVRVVAVAIGGAADQGGPVGDGLFARGDSQILAG